jgi:hypothetical protein
MRQTFRNQTASIILIYVERFGRYEFSNGPLRYKILVKNYLLYVFRFRLQVNNPIGLIYNLTISCQMTFVHERNILEQKLEIKQLHLLDRSRDNTKVITNVILF